MKIKLNQWKRNLVKFKTCRKSMQNQNLKLKYQKKHFPSQVIVKPKTNKLNTEMIEDKLISANEQDMLDSQIDIYYNSLQFTDFKKSGLDVMSQKCQKCELDIICLI